VAPHLTTVKNEYVVEKGNEGSVFKKGSNLEILFPFMRKEMKPNFIKMLKNKEIRL
jgi:hypothetical protein